MTTRSVAPLLALLVTAACATSSPRTTGADRVPPPSTTKDAGAGPFFDDTPLLPERPGVVDVYAVVFAGFALEDVFFHEAIFARAQLSRRFGTEGRDRLLTSHPGAPDEARPANVDALVATLAEVGATMNPDEDVLLLYLTSHGRKDRHLKVRFREESDPDAKVVKDDLSAAALAQALDDAGVKRRVVVISACFGGGFIDALASDETAVITAARADRPSFGCETGATLTYFGRAFLEHGLGETRDLERAFALAKGDIARWEEEAGKTRSEPQLYLGGEAGAMLDDVYGALDEDGTPTEP